MDGWEDGWPGNDSPTPSLLPFMYNSPIGMGMGLFSHAGFRNFMDEGSYPNIRGIA